MGSVGDAVEAEWSDAVVHDPHEIDPSSVKDERLQQSRSQTGPGQASTDRGRRDTRHQPDNLEEVMRCIKQRWARLQIGRNRGEGTPEDRRGAEGQESNSM